MALDDDRDNVGVCPVVLVAKEVTKPKTKVYRVSWYIEGKRQERFFVSRPWAEQFVRILLDSADVLRCPVDPMIGDVEVSEEL